MGNLDNPNRLISMVNKRGRVMWVHQHEVETFRSQGAKVIVNPKEDYYPDYDQELNKNLVRGDILENSPDELPVEEL